MNCKCDCNERDPWEIAVYLTSDELIALDRFLHHVTFEDLHDDDDVRNLWKALKEIRDTGRRRCVANL